MGRSHGLALIGDGERAPRAPARQLRPCLLDAVDRGNRALAPEAVMVRWLLLQGEEPPPGDGWLGTWELARARSMKFLPRRREFLLGRWACKRALAAALAVPIGPRLEVRAQESGAPQAFIDDAPAPLSISLSHRAGAALCALGPPGAALGADLELIEPRSDAFRQTWFTQSELNLTRADSSLLSNLVWSAKESALKAMREGLRRDPRELEVVPQLQPSLDGWCPLWVRAPGRDFGGLWRRDGDLVVTIVAESAAGPPLAF